MRVVNFFIVAIGLLLVMVALEITPAQLAIGQLNVPLEDVDANDNNQTTLNGNSSGVQQMALKAQLKPDPNEFLAQDGYKQVNKFGFVASNESEICPLNNCKYGVENTQFSPNTDTGGYTFEGRLKVTIDEDNVKKSKFYDFNVDLDKTSEEERNGKTLQFLEGTFGLGKDISNPEIQYAITNATYLVDEKSPILTIEGEGSPSS